MSPVAAIATAAALSIAVFLGACALLDGPAVVNTPVERNVMHSNQVIALKPGGHDLTTTWLPAHSANNLVRSANDLSTSMAVHSANIDVTTAWMPVH